MHSPSAVREPPAIPPPHWLRVIPTLVNAKHAVLLLALASLCSCVPHSFRVLNNGSNYFLQYPDSHRVAFGALLAAYNDFEPAHGWIDLRPLMELRIENAYYQKGASRRGLTGYLGTEVARYQDSANGLTLTGVQPMTGRPADDLPVEQLILKSELNFSYYRLYFEILFNRATDSHGSVLIGANTRQEIERLASQLTDPESVCNANSSHCAVFPEACSVSVEMQITVNGKPQSVLWRSRLESVAANPTHLTIKRLNNGKLVPVKINAEDANARRLPLLPGDQIDWR